MLVFFTCVFSTVNVYGAETPTCSISNGQKLSLSVKEFTIYNQGNKGYCSAKVNGVACKIIDSQNKYVIFEIPQKFIEYGTSINIVVTYLPFGGNYAQLNIVCSYLEDTTFKIVSTSPINASKGVDIGSTGSILFNKNIKSISNVTVNGNPCKYTIAGKTLNIFFNSLKYSTFYEVIVKDAISENNVGISSFSFSFTTMTDTRPLEVINVKPPPNSVDVPIDTEIKIQFNKSNLDKSTLEGIKISDIDYTLKYVSGDTVTLLLKENLKFDKVYHILVSGVSDTLGNKMSSDLDISFNTVKKNIFNLISYNPVSNVLSSNSKFEFVFNDNVDPASVKFSLVDSDGNNILCNLSVVGKVVTITPSDKLDDNLKYNFELLKVSDLNGNVWNSTFKLNFNIIPSTGNGSLDSLFDEIFSFWDKILPFGLKIVLGALMLGGIFIVSLWLWRKTKLWLKSA